MQVNQINFVGSQSQQQEQNIDSEQIRTIIQNNQIIPSLNTQTIRQILLSFKVGIVKEQEMALKKIKDKLIDIIIEQKDECANYLMLPKFKYLNQQTKQVLKQILNSTWNQYKKQKDQNKKMEGCVLFLCTEQQPKQIQSFHVGLYNFFKNTFKSYSQQFNPLMPKFPHSFNPKNLNINNCSPNQFDFYTPIQKTNNNHMIQYPPFNFFQNNPIKMQYEQQQELYNNHYNQTDRYANTPHPFLKHQNFNANKISPGLEMGVGQLLEMQRQNTKKQEKQLQNNQNLQKQQKSMVNQKSQKSQSYVLEKPEDTKYKIFKKQFISCSCKGKIQQLDTSQYFQCSQCHRMFHYNCLRLPINTNHKQKNRPCPICLLQKNNIFYSTVGEPIQLLWIEQNNIQKTKIHIKPKKSRQIIQNNYCLQLRMIKVTGRSMFFDEGDKSLSQKKQPRFNQVLIDDAWLQKNGQDIRINLNHIQPGSKVAEIGTKMPLILLIMFMCKRKSAQQILASQFEDCPSNFLDQVLKQSLKQSILINIMDDNLNIIKTPVRGINCQHADVFQITDLISRFSQLKTQKCPICNRKISNVYRDRMIQNKIQQLQQQGNQELINSNILYKGDGRFQTPQLEEEDKKMEMDNNNDNVSLSMSNLEEGQSQNDGFDI